MAAICECFCALIHPSTAASTTCVQTIGPDLFIIKSAALVGTVAIPVCRPCYEEHLEAEKRRNGNRR